MTVIEPRPISNWLSVQNHGKCVTMHRIYARVSTSDQNCDLQLAELHRYCQERGVEHADYVDRAFSGGRVDRPELRRLMADARRGDVVLVWKLDRFGRSVLHLKQMLDDLKAKGVRFVATSQGVDTDDPSATGGLMMNMLACIAEFERELIRERTALGVRSARAAGKEIGRPKRVFDRHGAVRLRERGLSLRAVSRQLGVPVSTIIDALKAAGAADIEPPATEPEAARESSTELSRTTRQILPGNLATIESGWEAYKARIEAGEEEVDPTIVEVYTIAIEQAATASRNAGLFDDGSLREVAAPPKPARKNSAEKPQWKYRISWRQDDKAKRREVNDRAEAVAICTEAMKVDMGVSVRTPTADGSTKPVLVRSIWNEAYRAHRKAARTEMVWVPGQ